jgi:hypothetical protein
VRLFFFFERKAKTSELLLESYFFSASFAFAFIGFLLLFDVLIFSDGNDATSCAGPD